MLIVCGVMEVIAALWFGLGAVAAAAALVLFEDGNHNQPQPHPPPSRNTARARQRGNVGCGLGECEFCVPVCVCVHIMRYDNPGRTIGSSSARVFVHTTRAQQPEKTLHMKLTHSRRRSAHVTAPHVAAALSLFV